jgi:F1F0 ATPase subunit 2
MMTDSNILLLVAFLAGIAFGGIFFGGLWLTIRYALSSAALGLWLVGSFIVRTAIVVAGFYLVFAGDWRRLTACLLGFVSARFIVARVLKPRDKPQRAAGVEASHAN